MSIEHVPDAWCKGHIIPIYKYLKNYRPITISSCLGKLFTSILNNRLTAFLEDNKIIPNTQICFLKDHRTADHILLLKSLIDMYISRRKVTFTLVL